MHPLPRERIAPPIYRANANTDFRPRARGGGSDCSPAYRSQLI